MKQGVTDSLLGLIGGGPGAAGAGAGTEQENTMKARRGAQRGGRGGEEGGAQRRQGPGTARGCELKVPRDQGRGGGIPRRCRCLGWRALRVRTKNAQLPREPQRVTSRPAKARKHARTQQRAPARAGPGHRGREDGRSGDHQRHWRHHGHQQGGLRGVRLRQGRAGGQERAPRGARGSWVEGQGVAEIHLARGVAPGRALAWGKAPGNACRRPSGMGTRACAVPASGHPPR